MGGCFTKVQVFAKFVPARAGTHECPARAEARAEAKIREDGSVGGAALSLADLR